MNSIRIAENPMIPPWSLLGRKGESISGYLEQNGVKFHSLHASGRAALFEGLKMLGCTAGDNVLLPAYICDVATIPFHELGTEMRFYDILPSLEPDMADLASKVDSKTKAIMTVNYFGFPQELEPVRDLCSKNGIFLIEDNSHGVLSKKGTSLLGTFGDIGFSSLYKVLATPNGGALLLNNDQLIPDNPASVTPTGFSLKSDGFFLLYSTLTFLETEWRFPAWIFRNIYKKTHPEREGIRDKTLFLGASISRVTVNALEKLDTEEVISRRRKNYDFWLEKVHGRKGVSIVFESLPEGTCPWVFPIIVEGDDFIEEIRSQGIVTSLWPPFLPAEVRGRDDCANYLAEHLFTLPVHQNINQKYLK